MVNVLSQALPSLARAAALQPNNAAAWAALAAAQRDLGRHAEALSSWQRVLALEPRREEALLSVAWILQQSGRLSEAREHLLAAQRFHPGSPAAPVLLGGLYEEMGDLQEAEAAFRTALALAPTFAPASVRLAKLLRGRLPEADRRALEVRLAEPQWNAEVRAGLLFALAGTLDAQGEYAAAAERARLANALMREHLRPRRDYDTAAHVRFVDAILGHFDHRFFARTTGWGLETTRPVFVIGLPRSGTTLVEQVLASHPQIHGAGELTLSRETFLAIPAALGRDGPAESCLPHLTAEAVRRLAEGYQGRLQALAVGQAARVVDKLPDNYLYAGFLATLFPRATFIHCRRDLRDVAVSCWLTDFSTIPWANDVEEIAARFAQYLRLVRHWKEVLPAPIHEVVYEDLVEDLEGNARRVIAACGLEWDPACLDFHTTRRVIRTASVAQVRRPIYRTSVRRWKNYEPYLADLFAALPRAGSSA